MSNKWSIPNELEKEVRERDKVCVVVVVMPARDKNNYQFGCSQNIVKIVELYRKQWLQLLKKQFQMASKTHINHIIKVCYAR